MIYKKDFLILQIIFSILIGIFLIGYSNYIKDEFNNYDKLIKQYQNEIISLNKLIDTKDTDIEIYQDDVMYEINTAKGYKDVVISLTDQLLEAKQNIVELENENDELYTSLDAQYKIKRNIDNLELLYKLAAAEAGYTQPSAEKNIVYVVLNRVNSPSFPNTIYAVVNQEGQFGGTARLADIKVTQSVKDAVQEAFLDYQYGVSAQGALYFGRGHTGGSTYCFTDSVGHQFWK